MPLKCNRLVVWMVMHFSVHSWLVNRASAQAHSVGVGAGFVEHGGGLGSNYNVWNLTIFKV